MNFLKNFLKRKIEWIKEIFFEHQDIYFDNFLQKKKKKIA